MGVGVALAVGTGMQILGNYMGNKDQAKAEKRNAAYYEQQRLMALREGRRAVDIFKTQSQEFIGQKISAISKSGVSFSGSLLMDLAYDKASIKREEEAIRTQANVNAKLAGMRADASRKNAKKLGSFEYNLMQAFGTGIQGYTQYAVLSSNKPNYTPGGGYSGPIV